jgi:hypothetical protein
VCVTVVYPHWTTRIPKNDCSNATLRPLPKLTTGFLDEALRDERNT